MDLGPGYVAYIIVLLGTRLWLKVTYAGHGAYGSCSLARAVNAQLFTQRLRRW